MKIKELLEAAKEPFFGSREKIEALHKAAESFNPSKIEMSSEFTTVPVESFKITVDGEDITVYAAKHASRPGQFANVIGIGQQSGSKEAAQVEPDSFDQDIKDLVKDIKKSKKKLLKTGK